MNLELLEYAALWSGVFENTSGRKQFWWCWLWKLSSNPWITRLGIVGRVMQFADNVGTRLSCEAGNARRCNCLMAYCFLNTAGLALCMDLDQVIGLHSTHWHCTPDAPSQFWHRSENVLAAELCHASFRSKQNIEKKEGKI